MYYRSVRESVKEQFHGAEAIFKLLHPFWKRRCRITDEPTEQQAIRDFKAVLHGMKDGTVSASNISDHIAKGKRTLLDRTHPNKQHGGARVTEYDELEGI